MDPVGACVGMNGASQCDRQRTARRKIDIITWNENPAMMIENALSPAKVISVIADAEEKSAKVIVPDYHADFKARLTGFKIDIKSETQAREYRQRKAMRKTAVRLTEQKKTMPKLMQMRTENKRY